MKRFIAILLAMGLLLSMTGLAFAAPVDSEWFNKWKSGAKVKGDIYKNIFFENRAKAITGNADAEGNSSATSVDARAESKSDGKDSSAKNESAKAVLNDGVADAFSGVADAFNEANNSEDEVITETAEAAADTSICVDAEVDLGDVMSSEAVDGIDGKCCPAEVKGDIAIDVAYINKAKAVTGDAVASGNSSATDIISDDKALACDGGSAKNNSTIDVINTGTAKAFSGEAIATNLANNDVCIDIFRGAMSSKTIDIFVELMLARR